LQELHKLKEIERIFCRYSSGQLVDFVRDCNFSREQQGVFESYFCELVVYFGDETLKYHLRQLYLNFCLLLIVFQPFFLVLNYLQIKDSLIFKNSKYNKTIYFLRKQSR